MEQSMKEFFDFTQQVYGISRDELIDEPLDALIDWFILFYTWTNPNFYLKKYRGDRTMEQTINGLLRMGKFVAQKIKSIGK
jgi:hypothetical protein